MIEFVTPREPIGALETAGNIVTGIFLGLGFMFCIAYATVYICSGN